MREGLAAGGTRSSYSEKALTRRSRIEVVAAWTGCTNDQPRRPRHLHAWGKFVFTGIGLGLLIGVTLVMAGVYRGMVDDGKALLDNSGADLWVVQRDTLWAPMRSRPAPGRPLPRLLGHAGRGGRRPT